MKIQKKIYGILAVIVVIQLLTIMYSFQFRKEGTHTDELWSYGYANSFYTRDIFRDDNENPININKWISGEHLWDYLVVNEGEQFRFDSVYYNKATDISPFLHSMILHAICSFFPETFSLWYSFAINIVSFLVCMIFLFKTAQMLKGDTFAIWCCAFYGFSLAARDSFIYLRMYAMSTAMMMAYIYFTLKYVRGVKEGKKTPYALLTLLILLAWSGFITNFYNISLVGILTFLICVYLLCNKKIKQMLVYGCSMLFSLGAACLCIPNVFGKTISYGEEVKGASYYTLSMKLKLFLNFFLKKFCNVSISIYPSPLLKILAGVLVYVLILLIPVIVLVRREPFFKRWMEKIKYALHHKRELFGRFVAWVNWIFVILFVAVLLQILVTCNTANVEGMNVYADRYIFFLYPIEALLFSACVYSVVKMLFKKDAAQKCLFALCLIFLLCINFYSRVVFSLYLFPTEVAEKEIEQAQQKEQSIAEAVEGKNCIFITSDGSLLVTMSSRLMHCNSYFRTSSREYQNFKEEYMEKLAEGPMLLVVNMEDFQTMGDVMGVSIAEEKDENADTEYDKLLDFYETLVPETQMQQITAEFVFLRTMKVFLINP